MPIRLPFVLIGVVLLLSTFSYEDVERRLQGSVEDLWVRLEDRSRAAGARHAHVIRGLATSVGRVLDRLFGPATVSWQAIAVSVLLALAAFDLNYGFGMSSTALRWQAVAFLVLASLPLFQPRLAVVTFGALLALLATVLVSAVQLMLSLHDGGTLLTPGVLLWFGTVPLAFASALLVLWFERRLLRWLSDGPSLVRAALTVLACAAAISVVVVGPIVLAGLARPARHAATGPGLTMQMSQPPLPQALMDLAAMNVFTVLPLALLLVAAASLAVHRTLWEVVVRPIYEVQRTGYRRAARAIGVACLLYGFRISDSLLGAFVEH